MKEKKNLNSAVLKLRGEIKRWASKPAEEKKNLKHAISTKRIIGKKRTQTKDMISRHLKIKF